MNKSHTGFVGVGIVKNVINYIHLQSLTRLAMATLILCFGISMMGYANPQEGQISVTSSDSADPKNVDVYTRFVSTGLVSSSSNYTVFGGTINVSISAKGLTVTGVTANNKINDASVASSPNTNTDALLDPVHHSRDVH